MKAAQALIPVAAAGFLLDDAYRYVFCRHKGVVLYRFMDTKDHEAWYYVRKDNYQEAIAKLPCLRFEQSSVRGGRIRGFYYQCGKGFSKKIAFIVHGYRAEHLEAAGPFIDGYLQRGFDVFCCDHYAHGESQGEQIGYNVWESEDCLHWIDFLRWRFGDDVQIVLHGFSMGGGIVLKMCDKVPKNVKFIIDDSGYSGIDELLRSSLGPLYPFMDIIRRFSTKSTFFSTNTRSNVEKAVVPITFVHGNGDKTVPFHMGEEMYAICPGEKERFFRENVGHVEMVYLHPDEYWAMIERNTEKYFDK